VAVAWASSCRTSSRCMAVVIYAQL
jgi:hypothetical protein